MPQNSDTYKSWFVLVVLSSIMVLSLWLLGEKEYMNFITSNLLVSIMLFISLLFLIPISFVLYDYSRILPSMEICHGINTWATPILPLLNFIVYTIAIVKISMQLSKNIQKGSEEILQEIERLKNQTTPHLGLNRVSAGFDVKRTANDIVPYVQPKTVAVSPLPLLKPKEKVISPEDIEARIKYILTTEGACSVSKLAKRLSLSNNNVKTVLSKLTVKGIVYKKQEGGITVFHLAT